jgi:hypothetical protein
MMQKLISFLIILFFSTNNIIAQQNTLTTTGKWGTQIFLSDANGKPFENKYADVTGSAYFFPAFKYSTIELSDGRKYMDIQSRLNLVEHEVEFISATSKEGYIGKGLVSIISFNDTVKQDIKKYTFQSGFPSIDNQSFIHFYQVLCTGSITLLKSINKVMEERNNELSGEKSKEFVTRENWYIFQNGTMKRVKKDQAFFSALYMDKADYFTNYIRDNKVNFKNEEQITKMMNYLNTL